MRWSWLAIAAAGIAANVILASSLSTVSIALPDPPTLSAADPLAQSTHVYDRSGKLLATLHGEEHRIIVPFQDIPDHVPASIVAIEDADFWDHNGVDLGAVARALAANVTEGKVVQGASTITQQYVRNAFDEIGRERTLSRKIGEARAALQLEEELGKEEIITRYMNTVYFGRGAYGVEAAARAWFSKPIAKLRVEQAALLAGVIHAPTSYLGDKKRLKQRRDIVLERMAAIGFLARGEAQAARARPLGIKLSKPSQDVQAPYFVEYVRRLLKTPDKLGGFGLTDADILGGGLRVYTTLDRGMQRDAERAVAAVVNRRTDPEAALVAMTTRGEIRAMVGGKAVRDLTRARGFNYATQRSNGGGRQAGSAFKPFTLAAYLKQDGELRKRYRAPSRIKIEDERCSTNGDPWKPANYQEQGYGSMDVIEATEKSVNTVYAQLVAEVGPARVERVARTLGITSPMAPVCSITLGTSGVTPLEMARAYATLGARGNRPEILAITRIETADGELVAKREPESVPVMDRKIADKVNAVLERVVERGTGTPARIDRPAAGKTGTTEEHRDVWFVGHTPHPGLATAVWMGYGPDKKGRVRPMTTLRGRIVTGGGFAGDIWKRFMSRALDDTKVRRFPSVSLGEQQRSFVTIRSSNEAEVDTREDEKPESTKPNADDRRKKKRRTRSRSSSDPSPDPVPTEPDGEPTTSAEPSPSGSPSTDEP